MLLLLLFWITEALFFMAFLDGQNGRLERIHNIAARVITQTRKYEHIISIAEGLH
jgi:hypothetical protein